MKGWEEKQLREWYKKDGIPQKEIYRLIKTEKEEDTQAEKIFTAAGFDVNGDQIRNIREVLGLTKKEAELYHETGKLPDNF